MSAPQAWYKQFWPWFLIVLPMCAVIASFATLRIALTNSVSLVADDYYKNGKAINQDIHKIQYARQLGMQFSLEWHNGELLITQHGGPEYLAALNLEFYHPTLAEKDFTQMLTADASKVYRYIPNEALDGGWVVRVEGFDRKWRLQQRLQIEADKTYWLN
ncbi:MAG: FixH family protein [Shewanella algae]